MLFKSLVVLAAFIACAGAMPMAQEEIDAASIIGGHPSVIAGSLADDGETVLWKKCLNMSKLGEACVELFAVPQNLTVGFGIEIHNQTFLFPVVHGNETCLDDATLLKAVELIPQLAPFKKVIDGIIKVKGFIPGEVLSICLDLTNFDYDKSTQIVSGCADLDSNILCWKGKCVYKGDDDLGCFKKHI